MEHANSQKRRQFWLGMLISAASIAAIFFFINPADFWKALQTARYGYLGLATLGIFVFLLLRAVRWRFMLNNDAPWSQVFHIQNIGYMLNMLLPFRAGDVARAVLIGNVPPVTLARGISTMVVERVLDLLFIVTLLPFTLAEVESLPTEVQLAARVSGFIAVTAIVILVIAANQRPLTNRFVTAILNRFSFLDTAAWARRIDDLLAGLSSLTRLKDGFVLVVLSIVIWIPIILAYYATLLAVNLEPTLAMSGFVVCAAALSIAAPSSPGQIGVFHAGVFFALTEVLGQPEAESLSFATLYHALNLLFLVLMGIIGLFGTGTTFSHVVASTRRLTKRPDANKTIEPR